MTSDERFCVTVQAISPVQEIGISHVDLAVFLIEPDRQQAIVIQCLSADREKEREREREKEPIVDILLCHRWQYIFQRRYRFNFDSLHAPLFLHDAKQALGQGTRAESAQSAV